MSEQKNEFLKESLKNHGIGVLKQFYCHILAVCLGWAAYPLILLVFTRYVTVDVSMSVYSVVTTFIYVMLLLAQANDMGVKDRRPYKWARYKAKGVVVGALAGVVITILEYGFIAIANRFFLVQHPQFLISGVNSYVRMLLYVPLFWFYELIGGAEVIIPQVTHWSALAIIPFMAIFSGIGYWMGVSGVTLELGFFKRRKR